MTRLQAVRARKRVFHDCREMMKRHPAEWPPVRRRLMVLRFWEGLTLPAIVDCMEMPQIDVEDLLQGIILEVHHLAREDTLRRAELRWALSCEKECPEAEQNDLEEDGDVFYPEKWYE